MNEATFWRTHAVKLNRYGHFSRVENAVESGTPDVNYAVDGVQGWVELKVIRDGAIHLERFQIPWWKRRLRSTGSRGLWVIAATEDASYLYLWPAPCVIDAPRTFHRKWTVIQAQEIEPYAFYSKPWDWEKVSRHLASDWAK